MSKKLLDYLQELELNSINNSEGREEYDPVINEEQAIQNTIDNIRVFIYSNDSNDIKEALEHCVAYFKKYKPSHCGIEDDRYCSPYNDAIQALYGGK